MSDDDIQTAQERRAGETKHRAAVAKLRERWAEDGYDPNRHAREVLLDGDSQVIQGFYNREHDALRQRREFASWLALYDMLDLSRAAQRQRTAEYRATHGT